VRTYVVEFLLKHGHVADKQYVTARSETQAKLIAVRKTDLLAWDDVQATPL